MIKLFLNFLLSAVEKQTRARTAESPLEVRTLIRQMSLDNRLWGAPQIHGEFMKLGYDICESTISKYMVMPTGAPSQTWQNGFCERIIGSIRRECLQVADASRVGEGCARTKGHPPP